MHYAEEMLSWQRLFIRETEANDPRS
jgi:hypothetical protein